MREGVEEGEGDESRRTSASVLWLLPSKMASAWFGSRDSRLISSDLFDLGSCSHSLLGQGVNHSTPSLHFYLLVLLSLPTGHTSMIASG